MTEHIGFDVAKLSFVEVLDFDCGIVEEQDRPLRDLIVMADGNRAVGIDPKNTCVEIRYLGVDQGDRTYTMPSNRIKRSPELVSEMLELVDEAGIREQIEGLDR